MNEGEDCWSQALHLLTEGIAGIELAGGAKRAVAVKFEALEPGEYGRAGSGEARCGFETLPREGRRMLEQRLTPSLAICPGLKPLGVCCGGSLSPASVLSTGSTLSQGSHHPHPLVPARRQ